MRKIATSAYEYNLVGKVGAVLIFLLAEGLAIIVCYQAVAGARSGRWWMTFVLPLNVLAVGSGLISYLKSTPDLNEEAKSQALLLRTTVISGLALFCWTVFALKSSR